MRSVISHPLNPDAAEVTSLSAQVPIVGEGLEAPIEVVPVAPSAPDPWGGLPPPGKRPIVNRQMFVLELVGVFLVYIALLLTWHYVMHYVFHPSDDTYTLIVLFAAPAMALAPPILWWRYRRGERGLPFLLTRRNLFSSVAVGALAGVIVITVLSIVAPLVMLAMGLKGNGGLHLFAAWRGQGTAWLAVQTLLFMVIIGPVEELFARAFVQDQANRVLRPWQGILLASVLFVLMHVPIDFLVYHVDFWGWMGRWVNTGAFAVSLGIFYHWSRNIWGPAVYHGLWDWFLTMFWVGWVVDPSLTGPQNLAVAIVMEVIEVTTVVSLAYAGYRLWWKGDRPSGSLGLGAGVASMRGRIGRSLEGPWARLSASGIARSIGAADRHQGPRRQVFSLGVVLIVLLGTLGVTGALGLVPGGAAGGGAGEGQGGEQPRVLTYNESDYATEGDTISYDLGEAQMRVLGIDARLTWTDEAAASRRYTNTPDTLNVELRMPDGTSLAVDEGDTGSVTASWTTEVPVLVDSIAARVTAVSCGDQVPIVNLLGLRARADGGNDFSLTVEVTVLP
jgi:membrane protease YdiL (CAAX protease family)